MPPPPAKGAARDRAGKRTPGAGPGEKRTRGKPPMEPPRPGWALTLQGLASLPPTQRRRHLLFGDLLEDVGAAASIFPSGLVEVPYRMPDPGIWTQSRELPAERQNRLLGVLRAAEARGRVRALRLRYTRMRVSRNPRTPHRGREDRPSLREGVDGWAQPGRSWGAVRCSSASSRPQAEEIALLIQRQDSARAAMRLELFLPPQLKPTRIPDPLNRQERRRVETILEEAVDDRIFPR
ncbi:protein LKAAEAR1 isoform X1 [Castor canadensis]|uniref:Protein LKAAEAR1 isoform X1 n=1 Tax=Castor canadensis TaxID=51338 RepID=A0AC58MPG5_CASCN